MNPPKEVQCIQCPGAFLLWPHDTQYATHTKGMRLLCGVCIAKGVCDECGKSTADMALCDAVGCTVMVCDTCNKEANEVDTWFCDFCKKKTKRSKTCCDEEIKLLQARILETIGLNIQSRNGLDNLILYTEQLRVLFQKRGDPPSLWHITKKK